MSNGEASHALPHTIAKRLLALLTLVALLVTFSTVRVADAEDPSLENVASTLNDAGLLGSTSTDADPADETQPDVAIDGSTAEVSSDEAPIADEAVADEPVVEDLADDQPAAQTDTGDITESAATEPAELDTIGDTTADAADEVQTAEPTDAFTEEDAAATESDMYTEEDAVAAEPTDAFTEEDAAASESDMYTEEDAVAEAADPKAAGLPVNIPVHISAGDPESGEATIVLGGAEGDDETNGDDDEADEPTSSSFSNGGVESNDFVAGDEIPVHGTTLGVASTFGDLLVETVTDTVASAITQVLPIRIGVLRERPQVAATPDLLVDAAGSPDETASAPSTESEELLIASGEIPGPPSAIDSDEAGPAVEAPIETTATTAAPVTTTTSAAPTTIVPTAQAPTTQAPTTVAPRPRPAPTTTTTRPAPTSTAPAAAPPVTSAPTTTSTTAAPTTTAAPVPTTVPPTTVPPTTVAVPTTAIETAAPVTTEPAAPEQVAVVDGGGRESEIVIADEAPTADEQALELPSSLGAFEFRGNAARLGAVWALWVLGTVAIMALWLPIPALRRNSSSSLPRRRS